MSTQYQPVYRALRTLNRVKFPDGTYHDVQPGEPVPGAENWPNPHLWCKRLFIERIDGRPSSPMDPHGPYVPPHSLTEEEIAEIADRQKRKLAGEVFDPPVWDRPTPQQAEEFSRQPSAIREPTKVEMDATPKNVPASAKSLQELAALKRGELFKLAKESKIKVNGSENREQLARMLIGQ